MDVQAQQRPIYAAPADFLRRIAPGTYALLRRWRRSFADRRQHPARWLYRELANGFREGYPLLFRVLQPFSWTVRAALRLARLPVSPVVVIVVLVMWGLAGDGPAWAWISGATGGGVVLVLVAAVGLFDALERRVERRLQQLVHDIEASARADGVSEQLVAEVARAGALQAERLAEEIASIRAELATFPFGSGEPIGELGAMPGDSEVVVNPRLGGVDRR